MINPYRGLDNILMGLSKTISRSKVCSKSRRSVITLAKIRCIASVCAMEDSIAGDGISELGDAGRRNQGLQQIPHVADPGSPCAIGWHVLGLRGFEATLIYREAV